MARRDAKWYFRDESPARILVVDDSPSLLHFMADALRDVPRVAIDTSLDSRVAQEMCYRTQYDLLIVDYLMPGLDGISLIRNLRERDEYDTVPIVMVTSELERGLRFEALSAGATDFQIGRAHV